MNIKLLTLGPQNFDHTSMGNPGAKLKTQKPKTQNSNITQNPNSKIQNPKPKTLRVQPLISTDLFFQQPVSSTREAETKARGDSGHGDNRGTCSMGVSEFNQYIQIQVC